MNDEPLQPKRVFIVENDPDTLRCMRSCLERRGHTVLDATTLADALARIPKAKCDVLISDIGLEDGTGWELMQRLRNEHQTVPPCAIAMSGYGRNSDRLTSEAAGFMHHLVKPFAIREILDLMRKAFATKTDKTSQLRPLGPMAVFL